MAAVYVKAYTYVPLYHELPYPADGQWIISTPPMGVEKDIIAALGKSVETEVKLVSRV